MRSELEIRKTAIGTFNLTDGADPSFELNDISEAQLLAYLKKRKLIGTTAEAVLEQFDGDERRTAVHVLIDRSL
jgi:hypothetical protein